MVSSLACAPLKNPSAQQPTDDNPINQTGVLNPIKKPTTPPISASIIFTPSLTHPTLLIGNVVPSLSPDNLIDTACAYQ
ncbi:MAG: hypothetical protein OYH77_07600 [Pseudomonadota bacterium]|nr:hypothetical protein [Pseudomonadota bacterium]